MLVLKIFQMTKWKWLKKLTKIFMICIVVTIVIVYYYFLSLWKWNPLLLLMPHSALYVLIIYIFLNVYFWFCKSCIHEICQLSSIIIYCQQLSAIVFNCLQLSCLYCVQYCTESIMKFWFLSTFIKLLVSEI